MKTRGLVLVVLAVIFGLFLFLIFNPIKSFLYTKVNGENGSLRVLFLGNSVLNANGGSLSPFEGFCKASGMECNPISHFDYFGRNLKGRIDPFIRNQVRDRRIIDVLESESFDHVVLVTRSTDFLEPRLLRETVKAFQIMHERIASSGAVTVIFLAHTPRKNPHTITDVVQGHLQVKKALESMSFQGKRHPLILVPVGPLWDDGRKHFGDEAWYSDHIHGTKLAQYANGCLWYAYLTGKDPRKNLFMNNVSKEQSEWIKNRVWWYINNFN